MPCLLNPYVFGGALPGAVFEVDAGLVGSFSGASSQTFANIVSSPADSASQTDYDFYRGTTSSSETSDPTFNGTAGANSDVEYFSFDGGDLFTLAGSNTTFINSLHKDNAVFTWYGFLQYGSTATNSGIFGTISAALTNIGISVYLDASGNLVFNQGDGTNSNIIKTTSTIPVSANTKAFIALSYNEATGVGLFYSNGASKVTESFLQAYTSPSSGAAAGKLSFLAGGASFRKATNNSKCWRSGMFNVALTDTQLTTLFNLYKSKIGF